MDRMQQETVNRQFEDALLNARQGAKLSLADIHKEVQQFAGVRLMLDDLDREVRLIHKESLAWMHEKPAARRAASELGHIEKLASPVVVDPRRTGFPAPRSAYQEAYSMQYLFKPDPQ